MNSPAIKTYTADSMRQALVMVRRDLGPDALIVSQDTFDGKTVLHATLEEPGVARVSEPERSTVVEVELPMDAMLADEHVELSQTESVREAEQLDFASALNRLTYPCDAITIDQLRGRFRFVGASGVGKTSLLIKLLVEWVMINGPGDVLVMSTNNQQLAANEALQLTCQLLGVEMVTTATIRTPTARSLVLIDTTATELARQAAEPGVRDVLVVSAMHSKHALEAQLDALQGNVPGLLGITHVDQPFDRHELATWLLASGVKPAFIGASAYLPGGIQIADQTALKVVMELTDA